MNINMHKYKYEIESILLRPIKNLVIGIVIDKQVFVMFSFLTRAKIKTSATEIERKNYVITLYYIRWFSYMCTIVSLLSFLNLNIFKP